MSDSSVLERVAETILRYNMAPAGCRLGVAVSGGADSVFLLHVLKELASRWNLHLTVLHLNHGLRGRESDEDAVFVEQLSANLGITAINESITLGSGNLEEAGREARLGFFRRVREDGLIDRVATGHTRSDQAETVLYRLIRGAGTAGLAGILPVTREGLVRPLLDCRRGEIEDWLRQRGLPWREDSTNQSRTFLRNRIRHDLLPVLARDFNPAVDETLATTAVIAQAEEDYWAGQISELAAAMLTVRSDAVLLDVGSLVDLHPAVARRLIRHCIARVKGDLRSIDFFHVEGILRLALQTDGHGRMQAPGLDVFRSFDWLRISPPKTGRREDRDYDMPLPVPGEVEIPGAGIRLIADVVEFSGTTVTGEGVDRYNSGSAIDPDQVTGPLRIRNWRPGDRLQRAGGAEERVKFLFQQGRVPIWERQAWPVITSGDRIVWIRRFGVAADCAPSPASRRLVRISELEGAA